MYDLNTAFPDDVPIADAAEQQRSSAEWLDEDYARQPLGDVPLELSASDWQQQQETVLIDPEAEEPDH